LILKSGKVTEHNENRGISEAIVREIRVKAEEKEFGEKLKKVREERGLTQQTLAERLYVTRQAVSRWECGARYPDLLTAKKIATILDVSLDELVSGEKLTENIEREPVLARPVENTVQTVLYTVATIVYLLLCMFSLYSYIRPNEALANTPAGQITPVIVCADAVRLLHFLAAGLGVILSARNRLNARLTGAIMCVPYALAAVSFLVTFTDMQIKKNGCVDFGGWVAEFVIPLCIAVYIILFFVQRERRIPFIGIPVIGALTVFYLVEVYVDRLARATDLGFVVMTVHLVGKVGMACLLMYQGYVWYRKKKAACDMLK